MCGRYEPFTLAPSNSILNFVSLCQIWVGGIIFSKISDRMYVAGDIMSKHASSLHVSGCVLASMHTEVHCEYTSAHPEHPK